MMETHCPFLKDQKVAFCKASPFSKMLPYAGGMSYRNQPTEEQTAQLIKLCRDSGYRGWYGIESSGRDGIKQGTELLKKYLKI